MKYTIQDALKYGQSILDYKKIPPIEARFMLEWILKKNFTELINSYSDQLSEVHFDEYKELLNRRLEHVPIQYLLKHQSFYGYDFFVDERVLIPRPETERLVEMVIEQIVDSYRQGIRTYRILDMCTGSGCILISIMKYFEENTEHFGGMMLEGYGADISADALEVARFNEEQLLQKPCITWLNGDLFQALPTTKDGTLLQFQMIVSNPPYISPKDISELSSEVKDHEPYGALNGGITGLDFYHAISSQGRAYLDNQGKIYFEIGNGQMKDIIELMMTDGYNQVTGEYDLYRCERIVHGVFLREA